VLYAEHEESRLDPQGHPRVIADTQLRKQIAMLERKTFASSRQLLGLVIIIVILLGRTG
jgi:hypothetical protein